MGDQSMRTSWGIATDPNWVIPPLNPPGVDGASFLRGDIPNQAFRGFQGAAGLFQSEGGFGVSARPNSVPASQGLHRGQSISGRYP